MLSYTRYININLLNEILKYMIDLNYKKCKLQSLFICYTIAPNVHLLLRLYHQSLFHNPKKDPHPLHQDGYRQTLV